MKKLIAMLLVCTAVISLAACSSNNTDSNSGSDSDKYVFAYNNVEVKMDEKAEDIIKKLGSDYTYFESASCAFEGQGMDKQYKYGEAFEVGTYPKDKVDYVSYVYLYNDKVSTKEGVKVGDSVDDMKKAYGDGTEELGTYEYKGADMTLKFITTDNVIEEIDYCSNATK